MSSAALLTILKEQRANVVGAASLLGDAFGSDRTMNSRDRVELEGHFADIDLLDARIERMTRAAMADVDAEKRSANYVYTRGGTNSWLLDKINAGLTTASRASVEARARLDQHEAEVRREIRNMELERESVFTRSAAQGGWNVERRALSTSFGVGGDFSPPLWAIQDFGHLPRAAAPLTSLIDVMPLPRGILEIDVPRITSDPGVGVGTLQNSALTDDGSTTTSYSKATVQTITAKLVMSQQLLDQANQGMSRGIDEIFFDQMRDDFSAQLEAQLMAGTGPANRQLLGLMNIAGSNAVTYTSGAPTGPAAQIAIAQAAALITDTRLRAPGSIFMVGRRWFWMSSTEDTATRPLGNLGGNMVDPTGSDAGPFGPIHGLGVFADAAIPTTLGVGSNQDAIVLTRPRDLLVWQTTPDLQIKRETYADSMGVLLVFSCYIAAALDIYPSATAIVTGTGLTAPAGY
jgi:HK97 family phage major capsid protein